MRVLSVETLPVTDTVPMTSVAAGVASVPGAAPLVSAALPAPGAAGVPDPGAGAVNPDAPPNAPPDAPPDGRGRVTRTVVSAPAAEAGAVGSAAARPATSRRPSSVALAARDHGGRRRLAPRGRCEVELVLPAGDADDGAGGQLAAQNELRERVLEQALDGALERPCAQRRVEAAVDE